MPLPSDPKVEVSDDELNEADFDDYEESDLSSGELDDPQPSGRKQKRGEYRSAMVLATPRIIMNPVSSLYEDIEAGDIDLEPDYQRDVVWPKAKQSAIIESLLRHYYIPPILFSSCKAGTGGQKYTCIDGKQRLSSIRNFMNNEIPVKDATGKNFWFKSKGPGRPGLPLEVAKRFKRESVPTVIYENLEDEQEREMFQRVQMGMVLSPAEKVYARKGPWHDFIKEMTHKYMDHTRPGQNLCHITKTERAREWMSLAQITLLIMNADNPSALFNDGSVGVFMEKHPEGPTNQLKKEAEQAIDRFVTLANDERWNTPLLPRTSGRGGRLLSPAEFAHVGFMCWRCSDSSFYDLARWAQILRTECHEKFPGHVHFNSKVTKFLRDRIESFADEAASGGSTSANGASGNRKRRADEDNDGEDARSRARPRPSREERTALRSVTDANAVAVESRQTPRQRGADSHLAGTINNPIDATGDLNGTLAHAFNGNTAATSSNGVRSQRHQQQDSPSSHAVSQPLFFDTNSPNSSLASTDSLYPRDRRRPPRNPFI